MKFIPYSLFFLFGLRRHRAQMARPQTEEDYYLLHTVAIPEHIKLEVGGLAVLPDGRPCCQYPQGRDLDDQQSVRLGVSHTIPALLRGFTKYWDWPTAMGLSTAPSAVS
jgi:hypothetical protein